MKPWGNNWDFTLKGGRGSKKRKALIGGKTCMGYEPKITI